MAKNLKGGIDSLLGEAASKKSESKEVLQDNVDKNSIDAYFANHQEKGLKPGETRFISIVQKTDSEKIKAIAHYNRTPIKEFMSIILSAYLETYINEVGPEEFKLIEETYLKNLK